MSKGTAIPLARGLELADQFALTHFNGYKWLLCGSARRKCPSIKDLDFVVLDPTRVGSVAKSEIDGVPVQVWYANDECWVPMVYFATGSGKYNIVSRACAKKNGMKLSRYGLYIRDTNERIPITDEHDLQEKVGRTPRPPEER